MSKQMKNEQSGEVRRSRNSSSIARSKGLKRSRARGSKTMRWMSMSTARAYELRKIREGTEQVRLRTTKRRNRTRRSGLSHREVRPVDSTCVLMLVVLFMCIAHVVGLGVSPQRE